MSPPATPESPAPGADPGTLAGKVLRIDEFGKPAPADGSAPADPSATATSDRAPTADTVPPGSAPGVGLRRPADRRLRGRPGHPTGICAVTTGRRRRPGRYRRPAHRGHPRHRPVHRCPAVVLRRVRRRRRRLRTDRTVLGATSLDLHLVTALAGAVRRLHRPAAAAGEGHLRSAAHPGGRLAGPALGDHVQQGRPRRPTAAGRHGRDHSGRRRRRRRGRQGLMAAPGRVSHYPGEPTDSDNKIEIAP